MMLKRPLLSIVIPTKNRYKYLRKAVELYLKISDSSETELIIQDNSDDPQDFKKFLSDINNDRIKYEYIKEPLSVVDNCNIAIKRSIGQFVTMIGDDDGWHRDIVKCAKYMQAENIQSLIGELAYYNWSGVGGVLFNFDNILRVRTCNYEVELVNLKKELDRVFKLADMSLGKLPCVYNGIVSRDVLEQVYKKTNSYFPGPSPDMANAIALAFLDIKHAKIKFPFSIAGKSPNSAGGKGSRHQHVGKLEQQSFLPKDTIETWFPKLPKCWTASTIYAQSILRSTELMGEKDYLNKFNYFRLYGLFESLYPIYKSELPKPTTLFQICEKTRAKLLLFQRRLSSLMSNIFIKIRVFFNIQNSNIQDIIVCEEYLFSKYPLERHLNSCKVNIMKNEYKRK